MNHILDGRSRGLEVMPDDGDNTHPFLESKVGFLHRTVRDFLDEPGMDFLYLESHCGEADLYLRGYKAALALMHRIPAGLLSDPADV